MYTKQEIKKAKELFKVLYPIQSEKADALYTTLWGLKSNTGMIDTILSIMYGDKYYLKDEQTGSYYTLENGVFTQYPMNEDGSRDTSSCEVDLDAIMYEPGDYYINDKLSSKPVSLYLYLKNIKKSLEERTR